jgi:hypothetical protein
LFFVTVPRDDRLRKFKAGAVSRGNTEAGTMASGTPVSYSFAASSQADFLVAPALINAPAQTAAAVQAVAGATVDAATTPNWVRLVTQQLVG